MSTINSRGWHEVAASNASGSVVISFPARVTEPLVQVANDALLAAYGLEKDTERRRDGLIVDERIARVDAQAAVDAAMTSGEKPPKGVRRRAKELAEELEDVESELEGARAATMQRYFEAMATWQANRAGLEAASIEDLRSALVTIAGGLKMVRDAQARVDAGFGVLWMFSESDISGGVFKLYPRQKLNVKAAAELGIAVTALERALGTTSLELEEASHA